MRNDLVGLKPTVNHYALKKYMYSILEGEPNTILQLYYTTRYGACQYILAQYIVFFQIFHNIFLSKWSFKHAHPVPLE